MKGWSTYFQFEANKILDLMTILCFLSFSTACQSSTVRKGGQAVASLCNQCWGFCGGPAAIPDYPQNVSDSYSSMIPRMQQGTLDTRVFRKGMLSQEDSSSNLLF